ncbi:MAG: chorismate mutase [Actinobacteria bacterium]|nr:chorismate mutase [Actinomycetota bacterium]
MTHPQTIATEHGTPGCADLERLRSQLDHIDGALLETIRDRIRCCIEIAHVKRREGIPMMQPQRIGIVQRRAAEYGRRNHVDEDFLHRVYGLLIEETCRVEDLVIAGTAAAGEHAP